MVFTGDFCWKCMVAKKPIKKDMRRHFMKAHGLKRGEVMEEKPKFRQRPQFYCDKCGVSFASQDSRNRHSC